MIEELTELKKEMMVKTSDGIHTLCSESDGIPTNDENL
jgi:hypothetical protein